MTELEAAELLLGLMYLEHQDMMGLYLAHGGPGWPDHHKAGEQISPHFPTPIVACAEKAKVYLESMEE